MQRGFFAKKAAALFKGFAKGSVNSVQAFSVPLQIVLVGHLRPNVHPALRLGEFNLALALGQFLFLLRGALIVAMRAAHPQNVVR